MKLFWSSFNFMNEIIQISLDFASLACSVFSSLKDSEDLLLLTNENLLPSHSPEPMVEEFRMCSSIMTLTSPIDFFFILEIIELGLAAYTL